MRRSPFLPVSILQLFLYSHKDALTSVGVSLRPKLKTDSLTKVTGDTVGVNVSGSETKVVRKPPSTSLSQSFTKGFRLTLLNLNFIFVFRV